jgi:hypothetical protein
MTEQTDRDKAAELLRAKIKATFPDGVFSGPITAVDGLTDEELDEQELDEDKALYHGLRERRWSEIEGSFAASLPDGLPLLADRAFAAFLPAWLVAALANDEVREFVVYHFSPDTHQHSPSEWMNRMDRRIRQLTSAQREAILAFLTYCIEFETSEYIKDRARRAVEYVARFATG